MVNLADVHQAVRELEAAAATGDISPTEASSRINAAKRAVTPRELWKASGGRAGANKRSDWPDIRKTVLAIILLSHPRGRRGVDRHLFHRRRRRHRHRPGAAPLRTGSDAVVRRFVAAVRQVHLWETRKRAPGSPGRAATAVWPSVDGAIIVQ